MSNTSLRKILQVLFSYVAVSLIYQPTYLRFWLNIVGNLKCVSKLFVFEHAM